MSNREKSPSCIFRILYGFSCSQRGGGVWLDSTLFVSRALDEPLRELNFYTINKRRTSPGNNISKGRWTSYFLKVEKHHPLSEFISEAWTDYFTTYDGLLDYFLVDQMINVAYENIPAVKEAVDAVPENNILVWDLGKHLNDPYSAEMEQKLLDGASVHKLSYKSTLKTHTESGALTLWGKMKAEIEEDCYDYRTGH